MQIELQPVVYAKGHIEQWIIDANFIELCKLMALLVWSSGSCVVTVWCLALSRRERV